MKNKSMNIKKVTISIIVIVSLVIGGIVMLRYSNNRSKKIQVSMQVSHEKGGRFFEIVSEDDSVNFKLDILYRANHEVKFRLFLLSNFKVIPFSLNGGNESLVQELTVAPSEEVQVSADNTISVYGLQQEINDLCFVLISDRDAFTKRFQILNKNGSKNVEYTRFPTSLSNHTIGSPYIVNEDENGKEIRVDVDFEAFLEGSRYKESFIQNNVKFNMAIVIFQEIDSSFHFIGCADVTEKAIGLNIPTTLCGDGNSIRIILFPYANQYDESFLSTYKMTLWSSPISIDRIQIGE